MFRIGSTETPEKKNNTAVGKRRIRPENKKHILEASAFALVSAFLIVLTVTAVTKMAGVGTEKNGSAVFAAGKYPAYSDRYREGYSEYMKKTGGRSEDLDAELLDAKSASLSNVTTDGSLLVSAVCPEMAVLPESADGRKLKDIKAGAFFESTAKSIVVPHGYRRILSSDKEGIDSVGAFEGSRSLETVFLPSTLTDIGEGAFRDCAKLSGVSIPYLVEEFGSEAFAFCTSLESVGIYGGCTIGDGAFMGCTSLEEVYISPACRRVGLSAFENTPWFDSLSDEFCVVGDGILIKYCGDAKNVVIPDGVRIIGDGVFAGRIEIESVVFPAGLEYVGKSAFRSCVSLKNAVLPATTQQVGENAFDGCPLDGFSLAILSGFKTDNRESRGEAPAGSRVPLRAAVSHRRQTERNIPQIKP